VEAAALTLQSAFRGFNVRKQKQKRLKPASDAARAAVKIQSTYRGFKVKN
jgi:hypothetical protein